MVTQSYSYLGPPTFQDRTVGRGGIREPFGVRRLSNLETSMNGPIYMPNSTQHKHQPHLQLTDKVENNMTQETTQSQPNDALIGSNTSTMRQEQVEQMREQIHAVIDEVGNIQKTLFEELNKHRPACK